MNEQVIDAMRRIATAYLGCELSPAQEVIKQYLATLDEPKGETVKVRAAAAVNNLGACTMAVVQDVVTDGGARSVALSLLHTRLQGGDAEAVHFVEFVLPRPQTPESLTVEGEVVE